MKKTIVVICLATILLALSAMTVFADQDGNATWCNIDDYGCWVTAEDGGKCYIMFWSEEARAYFMGGISKPGELVVDKPADGSGRLGLGRPSTKRSWKDYFIDMVYRHKDYFSKTLEGQTLQFFIDNQLYFFESRLAAGQETEDSIMAGLKDWDKELYEEEKK